jgi:hypothetical protein
MLSASGTVSTINATTTGTLNATVAGLNVNVKLSAPTTATDVIYIAINGTVQSGTGTLNILGGTGYNLTMPHWGTQYTVTVNDANGFTIGSVTFSTPAYVPGAPVITKISPTSSGLAVVWNAVPNASSYIVTWKVAGAASWQGTASTTNLSAQITGLSAATTYTVGVQAVAPDVV